MKKDNKIKERLESLLDKEVDEEEKEKLKAIGFSDKELDKASLLIANVFEKALKGNASALKFIAFMIEEEKAEDEQPNRFNDLIKEMRSKA